MTVEMDESPPAPQWPVGVTLWTHVPGQDDRGVYELMAAAFADHWGYLPLPFEQWMDWRANGRDDGNSLWFLAMDRSGMIVGAVLCRLQNALRPEMDWVVQWGVRPGWQERGLSAALLRHACGQIYRRGQRRLAMRVAAQALACATSLYEQIGMRVVPHMDARAALCIFENQRPPAKAGLCLK
jgi:GNAT superfamily N-acetyltransferase